MDCQTLRDWAHRFNEPGPDGLRNRSAGGPAPRPLGGTQGRTRRDHRGRTASCAGGASTLLKKLGFAHVSARPRHRGWDAEIVEAFKNLSHELCAPNWMACQRTSPSKSGLHANIRALPRSRSSTPAENIWRSIRQLAVETGCSKPTKPPSAPPARPGTNSSRSQIRPHRNSRLAHVAIPMTVGIRSRKEKTTDGTA
jgi:hypothetical protein